MKRLYSWNVNGIRACQKKGLVEWIEQESPDVLAIQETKAQQDQLDDELLNINGYKSYWFSAQKKGYSGVAIYSKEEPNSIEYMGDAEFDSEGRTIIAHYNNFTLINCYFPNSQAEGARLEYKLAFNNRIHEICDKLVDEGKNVVLCGDLNVAHKPIDLKNPKTNEKNPGYLPEEREWIDQFLDSGYTDTFRHFYPDAEGQYSWWSYRFQARQKNAGWRIDYFCVNSAFTDKVTAAKIHQDVMGSDHCPVSINIKV
ncbi:MAG: exodeoxyribonuclease III [Gammaproteobacteria bacterium]|nr:MAG: exodeoxyribonuclease III [Gammaproteobacteria bacterium]